MKIKQSNEDPTQAQEVLELVKAQPKSSITQVACPHCKEQVVWSDESPFKPFCSKRCRLIDLGDWMDESHAISTPLPLNDEFSD